MGARVAKTAERSAGRVILCTSSMAILQRLPVDQVSLEAWCQQWKVARLELFGSARFDLAAAQDIDLLVTFLPVAQWSLFDHAQMEQELSELLGRKVDLVSRRAIEASHNALRRSAILTGTIPMYDAG